VGKPQSHRAPGSNHASAAAIARCSQTLLSSLSAQCLRLRDSAGLPPVSARWASAALIHATVHYLCLLAGLPSEIGRGGRGIFAPWPNLWQRL
jgi:hypothetical protein